MDDVFFFFFFTRKDGLSILRRSPRGYDFVTIPPRQISSSNCRFLLLLLFVLFDHSSFEFIFLASSIFSNVETAVDHGPIIVFFVSCHQRSRYEFVP